jgi:hypothetical protein
MIIGKDRIWSGKKKAKGVFEEVKGERLRAKGSESNDER